MSEKTWCYDVTQNMIQFGLMRSDARIESLKWRMWFVYDLVLSHLQ